MFADFYHVVPVAVNDEDVPDHAFETNTTHSKASTQDVFPKIMFRTCDTVNSIDEIGAYSPYLSKRQYTELTKDMIELNQNWETKPNQRFTAAKALIGSVIIDTENNYGLLILALEVYGRDPDIDSHAEQRSSTGLTRQTTSVPSVGQNDFEIFTMRQTEGSNISIKLILGTHSFNALITASIRIDNLVNQPECGPNTVNFGVSPPSHLKYKLCLDSESWSDSLRTSFHKLDTYSASRSALFYGYLQQPMTVFTYGKNTTSIDSGALSSRFLAMLATSVMKDAENAHPSGK
ncbi:hypothetical protein INT47_007408 [Mucor saturninus]|uniref:Uncharacterized protein n=1 Tax=Mucor saturninus TaxID=64648 RepID=A0A8H7UWS3_9FUNG|nr:hypothetical protein INT47_007408 [Mucor saturninus]